MAEKAWGGVFQEATDRRVEEFTQSVSFDCRLYAHDVTASIAHAQMLATVGLISPEECQQIEQGLDEIRQEIEHGRFRFSAELEDIHMHIERALIERIGDAGRKLHTGRSRNDQVSTDMRLWVRQAIDEIDQRLVALQRAFVGRCGADADCILPGYTHMQRAQPVLAPHYWLAYCEKFQRDRERLADARRRANVLSLGTAALAGTSLPIDRQDVARRLGFDALAANSLDASGDRDFIVELAFVLAMIAEHLSGWAEEWILWSTAEFSFLKLPEAFCTGSSIMPQKVNPDVLELIRGKTARVVGNLQALLVLLKGLPLAYNRDLQEDKRPLFDAVLTTTGCASISAGMWATATVNRARFTEELHTDFALATELADHLVTRGVAFREAHHVAGRLVRWCEERGSGFDALTLDVLREHHGAFGDDALTWLVPEAAVERRASFGGTAWSEVARQVELLRASPPHP